ncbi:MAG TPA: L-threonylcarbamoyladenylate synthase [Acidobacteriaceae bacterium]|nr:L-threonylcarbamoyladenylate synthase [Acidobacteriaceae bacterium]
MPTERLKAEGTTAAAGIVRAADLLRMGGTVAFPTETVYGLGANALDAAAVAKIFEAKERPGWDPLIVHIADDAMLQRVAAIPDELQEKVNALAAAFWPGPLTILLPRTAEVPDAVTAGRPLVGVRMPGHPVAAELIRHAGLPVAAPSANRFGRPSPTTAAHVLADLDGRIDAVLDGGQANVGVESTVFDLAARAIYRPGAVSAAMISRVIGDEVRVVAVENRSSGAPQSLPSPGMGIRHYAPAAQMVLVADQRELLAEVAKYPPAEVGVMLPDGWDRGAAEMTFRWGPWNSADILARLLYFGFRLLDQRGVKVIVCPVPTADGPLGDAIRERLEKAARTE